jgi:hypothetical protein
MVELFDAEAGRGGPFAGEPELLWDAWMVVDPEVAAATRAAPVAPGLRDELTRTVGLERRGLLHAERRLEAWAARQEPKPKRCRPSKRERPVGRIVAGAAAIGADEPPRRVHFPAKTERSG